MTTLISGIGEISRIRFAILYGSFLDGVDFNDIDIGVWMQQVLPTITVLREETGLATQLELRVPFQIDVKIINNAPLLFQYQVSRGRLIFYRDLTEYFSFIEEVRSAYFDFQYYLDSYQHAFISQHYTSQA